MRHAGQERCNMTLLTPTQTSPPTTDSGGIRQDVSYVSLPSFLMTDLYRQNEGGETLILASTGTCVSP